MSKYDLSGTSHKYACVMAPLAGDAAAHVLALGRTIPDSELSDDGRETDPHVTVLYGLHDDDPTAAAGVLSGEGPVRMELGRTIVFPANENRDSDVLVYPVLSPDLHRLNGKLAKLPNSNQYPEYKPHATVAYLKPGMGAKYAGRTFRGSGPTHTAKSLTFSSRDHVTTEIPLMTTLKTPAQPFYLSVSDSSFKPVDPPPGFPASRNDLPCFYYWGDGLIQGEYVHPTKGFHLSITPDEMDSLEGNVRLALSRGVDIPIVKDHKETADNTLGYVVDVKQEGDRLWLLHQFLGDDARKTGLKNRLSVGIDTDLRDGRGHRYGRAIRHSAVTPNPVIPNQHGFIAASQGQEPGEVIVLSLATTPNPTGGHPMKMTPEELSAVRQCMGAGDDVTADNALERLLSHAKGLKKPEEVATLSASIQAKDTEIAGLKAKLPKAIDPDILSERAALKIERIELSANKGEIPGPVAAKLVKLIKSADGKPNVLLLSHADELNASPIDAFLGLFEGMKFDGSAEKTKVQTLSRAIPDGDAADGSGGGNIQDDPQFKLLQKQVAAQNGAAAKA